MTRLHSGQTLIVIIAIMIVSLGIGVASSNRITGTLRNTAEMDLSSRAFAAAEAGAEQFLGMPFDVLGAYIDNNNCGICSFTVTGVDSITTSINVTLAYDGNTSGEYPIEMPQNDVLELNLVGYPSNVPLQLCIDSYPPAVPLNIYVEQVYGSVGSYLMDSSVIDTIGCHSLSGKVNPVSVRVRSVYADAEGRIIPDVTASVPSQGIIIESQAVMNSVQRKVRVLKSYNSMPSDFSYTLFQKSQSDPLSN